MKKTIYLQALADGFIQAFTVYALMSFCGSVYAYRMDLVWFCVITAVISLASILLYRVLLQYKLMEELLRFALADFVSGIVFGLLIFAAQITLAISLFPPAEPNLGSGIVMVLSAFAFILLSAIGRLIVLLICAAKARRDWV